MNDSKVRAKTITVRMNEKEVRLLEDIKHLHQIQSNGHMLRILLQWYKTSRKLKFNHGNNE